MGKIELMRGRGLMNLLDGLVYGGRRDVLVAVVLVSGFGGPI